MEGLGRLFNVIPIAADTVAVYLGECATISFVCSGSDTYTVSIATAFTGTYRAGAYAGFSPAWTPIDHYYKSTAADGSAAWTRVTLGADAATFTSTGLMTVFAVHTAGIRRLVDSTGTDSGAYTYIKCVSTGGGLVRAVTHDLAVQRGPANLKILSA